MHICGEWRLHDVGFALFQNIPFGVGGVVKGELLESMEELRDLQLCILCIWGVDLSAISFFVTDEGVPMTGEIGEGVGVVSQTVLINIKN